MLPKGIAGWGEINQEFGINVHTTVYEIGKQQGPTIQCRELDSIFCNNLHGTYKRILSTGTCRWDCEASLGQYISGLLTRADLKGGIVNTKVAAIFLISCPIYPESEIIESQKETKGHFVIFKKKDMIFQATCFL